MSADHEHMAHLSRLGGNAGRRTISKPAGSPEVDSQTISKLIESLRVAAGLSRRELAARSDLTTATIKRVECGNPRHEKTLERLRRVTAMKDLSQMATGCADDFAA